MKSRAFNTMFALLILSFSLSAAAGFCWADVQNPKDSDFIKERGQMVTRQIEARGIRDPRVLNAMRTVPRHEFVPAPFSAAAYGDQPLPIGHEQTISQPYIVAYMTEALRLSPDDRVLEIGTGSGYQAAVLAEITKEVYTIEIVPELAENAAALLKRLGYQNIKTKYGDGYLGWPEFAPFDAVIVTAAPPSVPQALVEQLRTPGGRMIVPVGTGYQELVLIEKTKTETRREKLLPVRFVPMIPGETKDGG